MIVDWDDEIRIFLEERELQLFTGQPDRAWKPISAFAGPETMEIADLLGRLTAWQNWIFQRPNAVGAQRRTASRYGTGVRGCNLI